MMLNSTLSQSHITLNVLSDEWGHVELHAVLCKMNGRVNLKQESIQVRCPSLCCQFCMNLGKMGRGGGTTQKLTYYFVIARLVLITAKH